MPSSGPPPSLYPGPAEGHPLPGGDGGPAVYHPGSVPDPRCPLPGCRFCPGVTRAGRTAPARSRTCGPWRRALGALLPHILRGGAMAKIFSGGAGPLQNLSRPGTGKGGGSPRGVPGGPGGLRGGDPGPGGGVRVRKEHPGPAPAGPAAPHPGAGVFDGRDLAACSPRDLRALRRQMQMVFQDTAASLNPRLTVEGILAEPLRVHRLCPPAGDSCPGGGAAGPGGAAPGPAGALSPRPVRGQRQRVGIARPWPCPPGWWSAMSRSRPWMCRCRPRCSTCWPTCRRRGG